MILSTGLGAAITSPIVPSLASAIQRFEGYYPGSVAYRNNNPGNLRAGAGQIGTDPNGYAIFPSYDAGFAALENQVQLNINRGLTLNEFFAGKPGVYAGYAPSGDSNNPSQYATTVAGWTGIDPNTPLSQVGTTAPIPTDPGADPAYSDPSSSDSSDTSTLLALAVIGGVGLVWALS